MPLNFNLKLDTGGRARKKERGKDGERGNERARERVRKRVRNKLGKWYFKHLKSAFFKYQLVRKISGITFFQIEFLLL